jgi:hypothetical protein
VPLGVGAGFGGGGGAETTTLRSTPTITLIGTRTSIGTQTSIVRPIGPVPRRETPGSTIHNIAGARHTGIVQQQTGTAERLGASLLLAGKVMLAKLKHNRRQGPWTGEAGPAPARAVLGQNALRAPGIKSAIEVYLARKRADKVAPLELQGGRRAVRRGLAVPVGRPA